MKSTSIKSFLILVFILTSSFVFAAEKQSYKIKGMHCSSCVRTIKASICKLPGMKNCKVKLGEISFEVKGDKQYTLTELNEILKTKGSYELY